MKRILNGIVYVATAVFWGFSGYIFFEILGWFGASLDTITPVVGCALWFSFMIAGCALILSIRKLWADKPNRDQ